jgi:hypothetical protein
MMGVSGGASMIGSSAGGGISLALWLSASFDSVSGRASSAPDPLSGAEDASGSLAASSVEVAGNGNSPPARKATAAMPLAIHVEPLTPASTGRNRGSQTIGHAAATRQPAAKAMIRMGRIKASMGLSTK